MSQQAVSHSVGSISQSTSANTELRAFIREMKHFILTEAENQRRQLHRIWSKPLATRLAEGHAIEGIHIIRKLVTGQIVVTCERNRSRFREGDVVCLHRGDPFGNESSHYMATIDRDDGLELLLTPQYLNWQEAKEKPTGWLLDVGYIDLTQFVLEAIDEAADTKIGRTRILPLLTGQLQPGLDSSRYARGLAIAESAGLNIDQSEALANAYATDLAHLIQGPPGTGKTYVLATLAWALSEEGYRVFITGLTHRAINNALNKLHDKAPDVPMIKIGIESQAHDLHQDIGRYETFEESSLKELRDGYVIGATPFATRSSRLRGVEFDVVIFDEASQITLPMAMMGMLAGSTYIFFGDHHQLPPVLTTRFTGGAFRASVFERLVDGGMDTLLTETYRLNGELAAWPNRHFYDGQLTAVKPQQRVTYPRPPTRYTKVLAAEDPLVFWDVGLRNTTTYSVREANAVVELVVTLCECGFEPAEIGVVVPYRAQARLIRNQLRPHLPDSVRRLIVIDTVERMQGQERELVIVSFTTSSTAFADALADFLFMPQRINVAVTRPRSKLILIGSSHLLTLEPSDPQQQEAVAQLRDLVHHCARVVYPDG